MHIYLGGLTGRRVMWKPPRKVGCDLYITLHILVESMAENNAIAVTRPLLIACVPDRCIPSRAF